MDFRLIKSEYVPSFGNRFEERLTPEYHKMLRELFSSPNEYQGSAIRGFHFSLAAVDSINPKDGKLWLFPNRPTISDLKEIALLPARDSWRSKKMAYTSEPARFVFCYEIHPSDRTSSERLRVKANVNYGSSGLQGIEVSANDSLDWLVTDYKVIEISEGHAIL